MKKKRNKRRGQVWIETVIYTLIAFSLIATVLAFVKPKIDELQDKALIEQSIVLMKKLDSVLQNTLASEGNKRILPISIKEGSLNIDGIKEEILFEMDSNYLYSEIGQEITEGNLLIKTEEKGSMNKITIKRSYLKEGYNITYDLQDKLKSITKAGTSYQISITNRGSEGENPLNIDFELV